MHEPGFGNPHSSREDGLCFGVLAVETGRWCCDLKDSRRSKHSFQKLEPSNQACHWPVRNIVSRVWVAMLPLPPRLSRLVDYMFHVRIVKVRMK